MNQGLLFLGLLMLISHFSFGQYESTYRLYEMGKAAFNNQEYKKANELLEQCTNELQSTDQVDSLFHGKIFLIHGKVKLKLRAFKASLDHIEKAYNYLTSQNPAYLENGDLLHHLAFCYHYNSKYKKAKPLYEKALEIYKRQSKPDTLCLVYEKLGDIYGTLTDYDKALIYSDSAEMIAVQFEKEKASTFLRGIYSGRAKIKKNRRWLEEALKDYEKALLYNDISPDYDTTVYLLAQEGLAGVYSRKGNFYKSVKSLEHIIQFVKETSGEKDPFNLVYYVNLGYNLKRMGQYSESLKYFFKAIDLADELGFEEIHHTNLSAYTNIGDVYNFRSNYQEAHTYYKKAYNLYVEKFGKNHPKTLRVAEGIASMLSKIDGKQLVALKMLESIQATYLEKYGKESGQIAKNITAIGNIYFDIGEVEKAISALEASVEIRKKVYGENHPTTATGIRLLASSYLKNKQYKEAEITFEKGLSIYSSLPEVLSDRTILFNGLATIYKEKGNIKKANEYLDSAFVSNGFRANQPIYEQIEDLPLFITTLKLKLENIDKCFQRNGSIECFENLDHNIHLLQEVVTYVRSGAVENRSKQTVEYQLSEVYTLSAHLMNDLFQKTNKPEYFEQSLALADAVKNAILLSKLQFDNLKSFADVPLEMIEQEQLLRSELFSLERGLSKAEADKAQIIEDQLFEKRTALYDLNEVFKQKYPAFFDLKHQNKGVRFDQIQDHILKEKQALILIDVNPKEVLIYCVSKNDFFTNKFPTKEIESDLSALQEVADIELEDFLKSSHSIYEKLLHPILKKLPATINNLIIVPDEKYTYFPFESLVVKSSTGDSKYLFENYAISYAYSTALLVENYKRGNGNRNGLLAVAPVYKNDVFADQLESDKALAKLVRSGNYHLPGALEEAGMIAEISKGKTLLNEKATEATFKKSAGNFSALHLSMHAIMDETDPMNSRLLFYKDSTTNDDGMLHAHELYELDLNAELVVLSACNTGQGQILYGEGVMSISRAFAYAGVPSTIMSLWKVPDESTSKIMISFYEHLKAGKTKSEALRNAKLDYFHSVIAPEQRHPYYWAGFILSGNDDPIILDSGWSVKTIILLFILAITLFWWLKR